MRTGKLVIAQGGGQTAVINRSLAGAVLDARRFPKIEDIYGARHGVRGIVDEDSPTFRRKVGLISKRSPLAASIT
jgi:6-phosphofructokinase